MYDKYLDIFASSPLFKNVSRNNTEVVLDCFKPEKKIYHKNNPILCTGDAYKGIGMVLEGSLIRNMLGILSDGYIETDKRLAYLKIKSASAKIALYILNTSKDNGDSINISLDMNRSELAVYLGLTRPTLYRELCSLRDLGAIAFDKNSITIINLDKLKEKVRS